jgi:hypothetical protein
MRLKVFILSVCAFLLWSTSAFAQSAGVEGYGGRGGGGVSGAGGGGGSVSGTLPFTGLDLGLFLLGGLMLVATGVALVRLSRSRSS